MEFEPSLSVEVSLPHWGQHFALRRQISYGWPYFGEEFTVSLYCKEVIHMYSTGKYQESHV